MYESENLEFKREYADDIKKIIVSFANTKGGELHIGVEDDGTPVGVNDVDEVMLKVSNSIRDTIRPDLTLFVSYATKIIDAKNILIINVQRGTARPYYIIGKGIRPEGVFVRQGASSVPASEASILKMIKETDGEKYEQLRSVIQELTFLEADIEFSKRSVPFLENNKKSLKIMNSDGIYTNLGLLISDQCKHTVKIAVFEGNDKVIFKDRFEFTGSLLKQLTDIYLFIDRYNRTHAEVKGLHRIDTRDYPVDSVREALLNSLVHRDYSYSASTLISIFEDRLEFVSIGGLVKGITYDDIMLGISIPRNENLANIFYRLSLIEAYGTGMPKIMRSYNEHKIKPCIEITDNAFKITLPNVNFKDSSIKPFEPYIDNEQAIIETLKTEGYATRKLIEDRLSISQSLAVKLLRQLVDKEIVEVIGKGKNTKYKLSNTNT